MQHRLRDGGSARWAWICSLASACAPMPQTAAEFRAAVKDGAFMTSVSSFDADRPFDDVAQTFKEKAPECLTVREVTDSTTNQSYQHIEAVFTPTVDVHENSAQLAVQRKYQQGVLNVRDEPPGGHYVLVADATPAGESRTHVDIYAASGGIDGLVEGVKGWATGELKGCPNLADK